MIVNLLEIVLVLVIFFPTKFLAWKVTDEWGLPMWLQYKPWECFKCLSFWTLTAFYLTCGLILHLWITMVVGLVLTVLDTIAFIINQKQKTIII